VTLSEDRSRGSGDYQSMTIDIEAELRALGNIIDKWCDSPESRAQHERLRARIFGAAEPARGETDMTTTTRQATSANDVRTIRDQVAAARQAGDPAPIIEWDIILSQVEPVAAALLGAELTARAKIASIRIDEQYVTLPPFEQYDPGSGDWTGNVSSERTLLGYHAPVAEVLAAFARGYYLDGPRRSSKQPLWDGRWMPRMGMTGMATEDPRMLPSS
jgi:hypothetical protein